MYYYTITLFCIFGVKCEKHCDSKSKAHNELMIEIHSDFLSTFKMYMAQTLLVTCQADKQCNICII